MKFDFTIIKQGISTFYAQTLKRRFTETHARNLNFIFQCIEADNQWTDIRHIANFLAQCGWESMFGYAPMEEIRAKSGTPLRAIQDKYWNPYRGRGILQVTHLHNHKKLSKLLNVDLVSNPELLLNPTISYKAAAVGMQQGIFTGKKLSDFINSTICNYRECRKIVNPKDFKTYDKLALYSKEIEKVLLSAVVDPISYVDNYENVNEEILLSHNQSNTASGLLQPDIIAITKTEAQKPAGWRTWKTTITTIASSLSISAASIWGWFEQKLTNPTTANILLVAGIMLCGLAIICLIIYMIIRVTLIVKREALANQITLKELEIRANPEMHNTEVYK